jgi:alanine racemase
MSLTLTVDGDRWRRHLRSVADRTPGLVPVAKGNGYGFGVGRLARKAAWLGADALAVGTYEELPEVRQRFEGDLLVLTPWRPTGSDLPDDLPPRRVIHTVSRLADLLGLLDHDP